MALSLRQLKSPTILTFLLLALSILWVFPHSSRNAESAPPRWQVAYSTPLSISDPSNLTFPFHDDFSYSSVGQLVAAGWFICSDAPPSYYSVGGGVLNLVDDGTVGGAVCWNNTSLGLSDWSFRTRAAWVGGSVGSIMIAVFTSTHHYLWQADGYYNRYHVMRDEYDVITVDGYQPQLNSFHDLRLDMQSGLLSAFFDEQLIGTFREADPTTLVAIDLPASWEATNSYDSVDGGPPAPPPPDFSMVVEPANLTLQAGTSASSTITLRSRNSFSGNITLMPLASGSSGLVASASPTTLTLEPNGTARTVLTVSSSPSSSIGTSDVIVTGSSSASTHTAKVLVTVTPPPPVIANFDYSPIPPVAGQSAIFSASKSSSQNIITSYEWSFGDGTTAQGLYAVHVYHTAGLFNVQLRVTDNHGLSGSTSKPVYVASHPYLPGVTPGIWASYNATVSLLSNVPVMFNATVTMISGSNITYRVDLFISSSRVNSTLAWIDVATGKSSPVGSTGLPFFLVAANLTAGDPLYSQEPYHSVLVGARATRSVGGVFRSTDLVQFSYPQVGVTFNGHWDASSGLVASIVSTVTTNTTTVSVNYQLLKTNAWTKLGASLAVSASSGRSPLRVEFTPQATGGEPPYTYDWEFGDGDTSAQAKPSHTYRDPGNYTVTFRVTDAAGNTESRTTTIIVTASPGGAPTSPAAPLPNGFPSIAIVLVASAALLALGTLYFGKRSGRKGKDHGNPSPQETTNPQDTS